MAGRYQQQNMDFKWQIARKIDRLDLGDFAAVPFFYRQAILFGLVRAIDPSEKESEENETGGKKKPGKTIDQLMTSIDERITALMDYDTTAILLGRGNLPEVKDFQRKTMSVWYENSEVIRRCGLTDNVRMMEEAAP